MIPSFPSSLPLDFGQDDVSLWESCPYCGLLLLHPSAPCDSAPSDTCPTALQFLAIDRSGWPFQTDTTAHDDGKRSAAAGDGGAV
jgi:hypothetical protein